MNHKKLLFLLLFIYFHVLESAEQLPELHVLFTSLLGLELNLCQ